MAKAKTYVVAEGYSFTAGGKIYSAGEVIPEALFADKTVFARNVSQKKILEMAETVKTEDAIISALEDAVVAPAEAKTTTRKKKE